MNLTAWAIKHGVSMTALEELYAGMGLPHFKAAESTEEPAGSESRQQSLIRLEAAKFGYRLFRNNSGVLANPAGQPVRFGLANDNAQMNKVIKSGDLIGWKSVMVTPDMVGHRVALFTSVECKKEGWKYTGTPHERAQRKWNDGVLAAGGVAFFANGPEGVLG
jgi:hypothetical protein